MTKHEPGIQAHSGYTSERRGNDRKVSLFSGWADECLKWVGARRGKGFAGWGKGSEGMPWRRGDSVVATVFEGCRDARRLAQGRSQCSQKAASVARRQTEGKAAVGLCEVLGERRRQYGRPRPPPPRRLHPQRRPAPGQRPPNRLSRHVCHQQGRAPLGTRPSLIRTEPKSKPKRHRHLTAFSPTQSPTTRSPHQSPVANNPSRSPPFSSFGRHPFVAHRSGPTATPCSRQRFLCRSWINNSAR